MSPRGWWPALAAAVVVVAAFVVYGLRPVTVDRFVLRAPDEASVALVHSGQRVCQGPVRASAAVNRLTVYGASVLPTSRSRVEVQRAGGHRLLAYGEFSSTPAGGAYTPALDRPIAPRQAVRVCVVGELNTFSLLGSPSVNPHVRMTGGRKGMQFSLALGNRRSLLGALPTAFQRAALFKASWVGSWTYWALTALLAGTFALAVFAVGAAAGEDERRTTNCS